MPESVEHCYISDWQRIIVARQAILIHCFADHTGQEAEDKQSDKLTFDQDRSGKVQHDSIRLQAQPDRTTQECTRLSLAHAGRFIHAIDLRDYDYWSHFIFILFDHRFR